MSDENELRERLLIAETRIVQLQWSIDRLSTRKSKRKQQSTAARQRVFSPSGGKCFYCQKPIQLDTFTIDHVWPLSHGGGNNLHNLVAACAPCNREKGDSLPTEGEMRAAEMLYGFDRDAPKRSTKKEKRAKYARTSPVDPGLALLFQQANVRTHRVKRPRGGANVHHHGNGY